MKFEDVEMTVYVKDGSYNGNNHLKYEDMTTIDTVLYYKGYLVHREDGPAVVHYNGTKKWFRSGKWHREDGPAVEWNDGERDYYLNDKWYPEEEYWKIINIKEKQKILDNILK